MAYSACRCDSSLCLQLDYFLETKAFACTIFYITDKMQFTIINAIFVCNGKNVHRIFHDVTERWSRLMPSTYVFLFTAQHTRNQSSSTSCACHLSPSGPPFHCHELQNGLGHAPKQKICIHYLHLSRYFIGIFSHGHFELH